MDAHEREQLAYAIERLGEAAVQIDQAVSSIRNRALGDRANAIWHRTRALMRDIEQQMSEQEPTP